METYMTTKMLAKWSLTALLTLNPAFAQPIAKATIPFDFSVGGTKMTAGAYTVRSVVPGTVQLSRDDSKSSAIVITFGVQAQKPPQGASLVFNRYGNAYFLSQVWGAGNSLGKQLQQSKPERESASAASSGRLASAPAQVNVTLTSSR